MCCHETLNPVLCPNLEGNQRKNYEIENVQDKNQGTPTRRIWRLGQHGYECVLVSTSEWLAGEMPILRIQPNPTGKCLFPILDAIKLTTSPESYERNGISFQTIVIFVFSFTDYELHYIK